MRYFASLMKENAKHRGWEIMLSVFAFLVILPISFWLYLAKLDMDFSKVEMIHKAQQFADQYFKEVNPWLITITIVLSLVSGIRGMAFVFYKSENDFYHSLPIKRGRLFLVSYVNTILFYLVPFVVCMAMSAGIMKLYAPEVAISVDGLAGTIALHILAYFMMCNIHIFLVMVTGRTVMALLGIAGIYIVGIIYYYAGVVYAGVWFSSLPLADVPEEILRLLCPPLNYICCYRTITPDEYPMVFVIVMVGIVAFLLAYFLYCRRPSEVAGTGIVYQGLKNVIKVVFNTLCGIVGTLLIYFFGILIALKFTSLLGAIVLLFFLVVGYILLQLIVEQDIKTCKRDLPVFIVSTGCAVLWMAFFQYDICNINGYMPKQDEIQSVAFAFTYDDDCEYRLAHMEYDDIDAVLTLAEQGLEDSGNVTLYGDTRYEFSICYHMKEGRDIRRNYTGTMNEKSRELIDELVDSKEYRQATYVFDEHAYDNMYVHLCQWDVGCATGSVVNTTDQQQELLEALRKDLKTISLAEVGDEGTLGEIQLTLSDEYTEHDISYSFTKSYENVVATLEKFGYLKEMDDTMLGGLQYGKTWVSVYDSEEGRNGVIKDTEAIALTFSLAGWSYMSNPSDNTPYMFNGYGSERYTLTLYRNGEWQEDGDIGDLPESVLNAIIWEDGK